jgi:hypothetical protein
MLAFGISFLLFFIFALMGYSLAPKKIFEFDKSFGIFISPVIGLAFFIIFVFTFSRLGFPLKNIKLPFLIYFVAIVGIGIYRNYSLQLSVGTFLKLFLAPIGILFSAWPILKYSFSWISYVNDDMNNYVLGAIRFYNQGFFSKPTLGFNAGSDYSQEYYYFHVLQGVRPGSEIYLSALSNLHNGNVLAIFMPAILTLQMILIFGTLALSRTLTNPSKRKTRFVYLFSIMLPLLSLGFLYQLIGQVGGLALGVAILALSVNILREQNYTENKSVFFLLGIFMTAELIWYPELLPFIIFPLLIKTFFVKKKQRKAIWTGAGLILIFMIVLLNKYFFQALRFGLSQIIGAQKSTTGVNANSQLFPFFLKPHGLPTLLGISPLNRPSRDPWESLTIVASVAILGLAICLILKHRYYLELPVAVFLFIIMVFVFLIFSGNGFGAFKIAMYAQPFLIITASIFIDYLPSRIFSIQPRNILPLTLLLFFAFFSIKSTQFYVHASTGNANNGFDEIQGGSEVGIEKQISNAFKDYKVSDGVITSTALNLSQIKLEAIAAKGIPLIFPTTDVFGNFYDSTKVIDANITRKYVAFKSKNIANIFQQPLQLTKDVGKSRWFLVSNNKYEAINHSKLDAQSPNWNYRLVKNPSNTLIMIDSSMGHTYYALKGQRKSEVIFQPEIDPLDPKKYMQGFGDNLLFEIINPSSHPYLVLDSSTSVIPQYHRVIPKISIWGINQVKLPLVGRGASRVLVPLPNPVIINGHSYFQLHIDQRLLPFPSRLSSISKLYGAGVELDARRVALFVSNISVVDGTELKMLNKPSLLKNFPGSLEDPNLNFSGIYEDGWISADSYFDLDSLGKTTFSISGVVPAIIGEKSFHTNLRISLDGSTLCAFDLATGLFRKTCSLDNFVSISHTHRLEIHFSQEQTLPMPDGREVAAQISTLGFN